jgi:integrase
VNDKRRRRGWAEGSIYKRKSDGRLVGSISLGYDGKGKRNRRFVYGSTKGEVQKKLRKLQSANDAGALANSGTLTLSEWLTRWLENHARPRTRPATHKRYGELAQHVINRIGGIKLAALRAAHVESLYSALEKSGLSARTRQAVGQVLCAALKYAVRTQLIPFSPADAVSKPRPQHREMSVLTGEQMTRLLTAAKGSWNYALLAVACGTGLRIGELAALQWGDIDLDAGSLSVGRSLSAGKDGPVVGPPKSKNAIRTVALPGYCVDALRQHRAAMLMAGYISKPVFCNTAGGYLDKVCLLRRFFKPLLGRAGLPQVRFHDLRHSVASQLLSEGHNLKAVSRRLGHASAAFTLTVYAHVLPGDDEKLAKALDRRIG